MSTFVVRLDPPAGTGPRLAVKDAIDVAGLPTTGGSRALVGTPPAARDAACLAGARAAGARIVGKANLHELCFGASGLNPWFGNPVNPLDVRRIPGGSSSGSAVAVATGEADVAFGTDTTGSLRTPAACCGVVGFRPTHGRVSRAGVLPLAPSLDTVGPMATTIAGVVGGMALLEPGFALAERAPRPVVGRLRRAPADRRIDAALDAALTASEVDVVEIDLPGWDAAVNAGRTILFGEAWRSLGHLYRERADRIGAAVRRRFEAARAVGADELAAARDTQGAWRQEIGEVLTRVDAIALPALDRFPPVIGDQDDEPNATAVGASLAGLPALALPVPSNGPLPASLQLVGSAGADAELLAIGARVEAAVGPGPCA